MNTNHLYIEFDAKSVNEGVARMIVAAFMMDMNPTLDEIQDVKTAVSEAVTNAIIHGYPEETPERLEMGKKDKDKNNTNKIEMSCSIEGEKLSITIRDKGVGIVDVEEARQPFFTTKPEEERSGMGFAFMETFMDEVDVSSSVGEGTTVSMIKYIEREREQ